MSHRLLLVRHGVTTWNLEGRFQGHLDPPLAGDGLAEARLLAARLAADPRLRPARVVSSPLQRARSTAAEVAAGTGGVAVEADPRLMEIGQGEWEGRTHTELAAEDAQRYAAWRANAGQEPPPAGETIEAALQRVAAVLDDLTASSTWPACVVSHGGILRLAARHLLSLESRRAWAMDVDNASLSVLARETDGAAWQVERWNDTGHLLGRVALHVDEAEGEPLAL